MVFKTSPSKEIDSRFSDDYLGTTVGRDWHIEVLEEAIQPSLNEVGVKKGDLA